MERGEITALLQRARRGDNIAEAELFSRLYQDLRRLARHLVRQERPDQTLGATALVHELYLRLNPVSDLVIADRHHFLALAAQVMRRLLVDHARARKAEKHGGQLERVDPDESLVRSEVEADELLAIDTAVERLRRHSPRQAQLVELRFFAGYDMEEAAAILKISLRTAKRDWLVAKTRLKGELDAGSNRNPAL